ncbi:MAG: outer membrane protein insertion porin family [Parasphingorhabdus sp.]|jgi:outer membrane protein insertion porin family
MQKMFPWLFLFLCVSLSSQAQDSFTISDIQVEGLQRISPGTVFNYLPVKVGDELDASLSKDAVKALFKTGFFTDVELRQQGSILVVQVQERPSIASITLKGNKDLRDEALEEGLTNAGFSEGRIFNQSLLDKVLQDIRTQYFNRGRYSAQVNATVSPRNRNRVAIKIDITEGTVARIKSMKIVGNEVYAEDDLLERFSLSTKNVFLFLGRKDKYSREKLLADMDTLRSFYQDNGYLNFNVNSTDVSISQNKQDIFISVSISEGKRFTVSSINVESVANIPAEELQALITTIPGDIFSRKSVGENRAAIADELANRGYAFAKVNTVTDVNEANSTVAFTFALDAGPKVYVRRIEITGNTSTLDEVIRRELRQLEGGVFSAAQVRRSRVRIQRLGFFDDVRIETPAVPGAVDQIDIVVQVAEKPTGSFLFGVGYSDADGVLIQASVQRKNLFGSGKELNVRVDNSSATKHYEVEYRNPYHSINGVSRSFNLSRREVDAKEANTAEYIVNTTSAGLGYRIPLSEFNSLSLALAAEKIELEETDETPPEFSSFITDNPDSTNLKLNASYGKDTRDSIFFPTEGSLRRISLEAALPGSDLEYFKVDLRGAWFKSLSKSKKYIFKLNGELGYGDGYGDQELLPFFKNYFAGGPSSVRGYDSRSLGPTDTGATPESIGGSQRLVSSAEILFPVPGSSESKDKRMGFFVDAGMVYADEESIDLGEMRISAGLSFNWFSPIGPLSISYGVPLNEDAGDDVEEFQLSLGALFR